MKRLRVGLTGGLASGKSTLAGWLDEAGFHVIDADKTVADLYRSGQPGADRVENLFGPGFLRPDGSVDREKLAERVFSDANALVKLETAIHPLVREQVIRWLHDREGVTVVEATLLVESGIASDLDIVVTVSAEETLRAQRALNRGMSPRQVESRLAVQGDDLFREAAADIVITNNGSLDEFRQQADGLISDFKQRFDQCRGQQADEPPLLVTSNRGKLREVRKLFGGPLMSADLDLPEIQSLDIEKVLLAKASTAWARLERPLIVEETSLELAGMNRFPGPLVKWMLKAVGGPGIARLAISTGNPKATARCRLLYRDATRRIYAEGTCNGTLVLPARGSEGFGWDPVFQMDGEDRTFGEMPTEEKGRISHRGNAWRELERILRSEGIF